jgi:hypothetical protein
MHVRSQLSLVLLALVLFTASSTSAHEPTKAAKESTKSWKERTKSAQERTIAAKEPTKDQASRERGGCVCIKFLHADLGDTQVYYAHEYDECLEELCPYPNVVYYTGTDLPVDQQCPDECLRHAQLETLLQEGQADDQPGLGAAKPENFDIYAPGDPDIRLNPDLPKSPKGCLTGIMHTEEEGDILVKIFFTRMRSLTVTAVACIGVEVNHVTDIQFERDGELLDGFDHVYQIQLNSSPCLVITEK